MIAKMPYKSLNHALRLLREQILEGLQYAADECPKFNTPEEIFDWLKLRTTYKNDPPGIELFMTLPSFMDQKNNYWKQSGAGDCDDFSIAALTLALASGFFDSGIVLAGRNDYNAVHIYIYIIKDKKKYFLDLTNANFNQVRDYDYKQEIPFILTRKEKNQIIKNMELQLAEGYTLLSRRSPAKQAQRAAIKTAAKTTRAASKASKRAYKEIKKNPYAAAAINTATPYYNQYLAPGIENIQNEVTETLPEEVIDENYLYLPTSEMYVREDLGDNMPYIEWSRGLSDEGYSSDQIAELSAKRKERKEEKQRLKTAKKEAKTDKTKAKADLKRDKGEAKKTRAEKKGSGKGAEIFNKVLDTAKEFIPRPKGSEAADQIETKKDEASDSDKIFGLPKLAAYGIGGALLLGGLYFATKKK